MDRRRHLLRSAVTSPIGYALVFPIQGSSGRVIGHMTQLLTGIDQMVEAIMVPRGAIAQHLYPVFQDVEATYSPGFVSGAVDQQLRRLLQRIDAITNHAEAVQVLYRLRQQVLAGMESYGTISETLPLLRQQASGVLPIFGTINDVLRLIQQQAQGRVPNSGAIQQSLPRFTMRVQAKTVNAEGSVAQMLFEITQAINARMQWIVSGRTVQRLATPMIFEIFAEVSPAGSINQRLFNVRQSGDSMVHPTGRIAMRLENIISNVIGARTSTIEQRLFAIRQNAIAGMEAFGSSNMRLPFLIMEHGTGVVSALGGISQRLGRPTQFIAAVNAAYYGSMTSYLRRVTMDARGNATDNAVIQQTLPRMQQHVVVVETIPGQSHQTLLGVKQNVQVAVSAAWGSIQQTLARVTQTLQATMNPVGQVHQTLFRATQSLAGIMPPAGYGRQVLPGARMTAQGWAEIRGAMAQILGRPYMTALGGERVTAAVTTMLYPPVIRAAASALNYAHVEQRLFGINQEADGWGGIVGHIGSQMLFRVLMESGGLAPTSGNIVQKLAQFGMNASARTAPYDHGTITQTLPQIKQDVRGFRAVTGSIGTMLGGLRYNANGTVAVGAGTIDEEKMIPNGRLTLTTLTPWLAATVSGATTVYYTPAIGSTMYYWSGTAWLSDTFSELSQTLSDTTYSPAAAVASSTYDMFVWKDGTGTYRVSRGPAWISKTNRGTGAGTAELSMQGGFFVNKNAITNGPAAGYGLYVGTIHTDYQGQLNWKVTSDYNDSSQITSIFNQYNERNIVQNQYDRLNIFSGDDPYWSSVVALVEAVSNTTIADVSAKPHSIGGGGFSVSTTQEKFTATPSILIPGGGNNINLGTDSLFNWDSSGTNKVCWEFWLYPTSFTGSDNILIETRPGSGGSSVGIVFFINSSGKLIGYFNGGLFGGGGASVTLNQWHHIAFCGTGGQVYCYMDGALQWQAGMGYTGVAAAFRIGTRNDGTLGCAGYYDQIRVTNGAVRYSGSSYTVPPAPFGVG